MNKKVVSVTEITALITYNLREFPECTNVWPQIFWHKENGNFNWDVDLFAEDNVEAEACNYRIRVAMDWLRAKYQVLQPG